MFERIHGSFAYQDSFRKAVRGPGRKLIFAEVYTETSELVFKYDTATCDLVVRKKFQENKDLWKAFIDLKPADITETMLSELTRLKSSEILP